MHTYYVYILTNKYHSVLYIGVTNNLIRRLFEHRSGKNEYSFSNQYNLHKLIYFESTSSIKAAIAREKSLKNWKKEWKWTLIKEENPLLRDLSEDWE
jgi:putative endonuclease